MDYRVLIDLGKLKTLYSGLGQFSYYYGKHISKYGYENIQWNFLTPGSFVKKFGYEWDYEKLSLKRRYFPAFSPRYHLWHAIHQDSAYMPNDSLTPYILTIHDLNFLQEKGSMIARVRLHRLQKKVNRAVAVTFISNYTAQVARQNLNLGNKPTRVIYNGVEIDTEKEVLRPSYLPEGKFLFTIGMILEKKNFHVLIGFLNRLPGYNLIIAGDNSDEYAIRINRLITKYGLGKRVILPGIISHEDKIYLYRHCSAFLFPSLMEGFGLPVIEAMRFGKPVFISRFSSLPEIGGSSAFYWDEFTPENMTATFSENMELFRDNERALTGKIKDHAEKFLWENSIREYKKLYEKTIDNHYNSKFALVPKSPQAKKPPLRVLHLSSEKSWRGGEQQIAYLVEELNKYEVLNFIACRAESEFEKFCIRNNWAFISLPFASSLDLRSARDIAASCRKNDIDILHMHTSLGHTLGLLSTYFGHKARLVLSRRVDVPVRNNFLSKWKYNHRRIDVIITVSDAIRNILEGTLVNPGICTTVHSGINIHKFDLAIPHTYLRDTYHIHKKSVLVGNTSALAGHKDYFTFINTAEYVLKKGMDAVFFIIGNGPQKKEIENYVYSKKLEKKVILTGFMSNINDIVPELDIFLMTSITEGLGTSILDAFACHIPVVATTAGGIPEMVIHEQTGLLADIRDPASLGENILTLIKNDDLRDSITKNAYQRLQEEFSRDITAKNTYRTYMKTIDIDYETGSDHSLL